MATSGSFDVVTVGGGLAASALAIRMARGGARVLVLEKETKFRDRVRGEGLVPWGVTEARKLGILELLMQSCAKEVPWVEMGFGPRNLLETTVPREPLLAYCHPEMQEILLAEAENSGVEVRRGVTVENVEPRTAGTAEPTVAVRNGTSDQLMESRNEKTQRPMEKIGARLVVGVDGRNSMVRKWAGFAVEKRPVGFQFAGVQLTGVRWREDLAPFIFNPDLGMAVAMVPQTKGRWRSYLGYPTAGSGGANRVNLQGENKLRTFVAESARAVPQMADAYASVECI